MGAPKLNRDGELIFVYITFNPYTRNGKGDIKGTRKGFEGRYHSAAGKLIERVLKGSPIEPAQQSDPGGLFLQRANKYAAMLLQN